MKKPAMPPLPWTVKGACVHNGPARVCLAVEYPEGHAADYIAHAANAYPNLVAALRETFSGKHGRLVPAGLADAHRALLAELGEGS